jgi:hypothetical protein
MFTRLTWQSLGKENCSSFSQFDRGVLLLLRLFVKSFEEVVVRMVPGADIDRNVREQNKQPGKYLVKNICITGRLECCLRLPGARPVIVDIAGLCFVRVPVLR